ncbi:cytochrome P450 [Cubamyces sp. BRFM 1775]|nr:cytochrome P450 [Cubamyces sp. BRFM 1775]
MNVLVFVGGVVLWTLLQWWAKGRSKRLPPGPKPLPLIGNLLDFALKELWLRANTWADKYGDVVYVHIFGQGILFLNTFEATVDLLDKRGGPYAGRPYTVMCSELCGCENITAFAQHGPMFRRHRRLMQYALAPASIMAYRPVVIAETYAFLERMSGSPQDYLRHLKRFIGSQTLSTLYGYTVDSDDDPYLRAMNRTLHLLSNHIASLGAGLWMVDIFPALKYLPAWFPGAGFKRQAATWKRQIEESARLPYEWAKQGLEKDTAASSYCTVLLEKLTENGALSPDDDLDIRWIAATLYIASLDTNLTLILHFILAMVRYPHVARKAQEEIDEVLRGSRLPTIDDRPMLPYVDALMSEVLRWTAPAPLGPPHRLDEDDVYNGMSIPKGTLVFANIWRMTRDPELFPNPEDFIPERYLEAADEATAKKRDPRSYIFGFGRRRCPGANFVESSLWLVFAGMLATFDFRKAKDEEGNDIEPEPEYVDVTFRLFAEFPCDIRPRSEHAVKLVQEARARCSST